jgi:hypothetical protein
VKIPVLIVATFLAIGQSNVKPDPPHKCADCDAWNKEVADGADKRLDARVAEEQKSR